MGREVRMVPADWEHPKDDSGRYIPLLDASYADDAQEFLSMANEKGLQEAVDWLGFPDKNEYMPDWPDERRTHYMMYECTSDGTPISPAFASPEDLARWLADNRASAFADMTATYEQWLNMITGPGFSPSCVILEGRFDSGVGGGQ